MRLQSWIAHKIFYRELIVGAANGKQRRLFLVFLFCSALLVAPLLATSTCTFFRISFKKVLKFFSWLIWLYSPKTVHLTPCGGGWRPKIYNKRQATWHDCLPSLLGGGEKWSEKVYSEEKIFCTVLTRAGQISLVPARRAQRTTKEGPLSYALLESLFALVSTVSRGHPSLVSIWWRSAVCVQYFSLKEPMQGWHVQFNWVELLGWFSKYRTV